MGKQAIRNRKRRLRKKLARMAAEGIPEGVNGDAHDKEKGSKQDAKDPTVESATQSNEQQAPKKSRGARKRERERLAKQQAGLNPNGNGGEKAEAAEANKSKTNNADAADTKPKKSRRQRKMEKEAKLEAEQGGQQGSAGASEVKQNGAGTVEVDVISVGGDTEPTVDSPSGSETSPDGSNQMKTNDSIDSADGISKSKARKLRRKRLKENAKEQAALNLNVTKNAKPTSAIESSAQRDKPTSTVVTFQGQGVTNTSKSRRARKRERERLAKQQAGPNLNGNGGEKAEAATTATTEEQTVPAAAEVAAINVSRKGAEKEPPVTRDQSESSQGVKTNAAKPRTNPRLTHDVKTVPASAEVAAINVSQKGAEPPVIGEKPTVEVKKTSELKKPTVQNKKIAAPPSQVRSAAAIYSKNRSAIYEDDNSGAENDKCECSACCIM